MSTLDATIHIQTPSGMQSVYPKTGINNVEGLQSAFQLIDDRFETNETNITSVLDKTGKNLWNVTLDSLKSLNSSGYTWNDRIATHTATGITFTVNSDMTITVNGTVGSSNLVFNYGEISTEYNGCMLSSTPDTSAKYRTVVDNVGYDTGNGILLTNTVARNAKIELISNSSISNVTFKPMICTLADWTISPNYVPYALPNSEITKLEAEDRAALAEVVDSGAKNLLNYDAWKGKNVIDGTGVYENNGVTLTPSGNNQCYTVFGANVFSDSERIKVNAGDIITFSWDYENASNVTATLRIYGNGVPSTYEKAALITAKSFDYVVPSGVTFITYCAQVAANNSGKTVKFKNLMICTKVASDVSQKYVPHRALITGVYAVMDKTVECSTTETTTGIKFVASEKGNYRITASALASSSKPSTLRVRQKFSSSGETSYNFLYAESSENTACLSVCGIKNLDVGGAFEVFAKYEQASSNAFFVLVEKLG